MSLLAVKENIGGKFGNAKIFLKFLEGEEMSYFIITDGITIKILVCSRSKKG